MTASQHWELAVMFYGMFNGGHGHDLGHARNRDSYRGPIDDRDWTGRGRLPNSRRRIVLPHSGDLSIGRRRRGGGSNTRYATGTAFQLDTNSRLPRNSPVPELAAARGRPEAAGVVQSARLQTTARNLFPLSVKVMPVVFSSCLAYCTAYAKWRISKNRRQRLRAHALPAPTVKNLRASLRCNSMILGKSPSMRLWLPACIAVTVFGTF